MQSNEAPPTQNYMLQSYSVHENLETFWLGCGKKKKNPMYFNYYW